jgi:transcription initiation factor TFIIB
MAQANAATTQQRTPPRPRQETAESTEKAEADTCPDCEGELVQVGGERLCEECGLIVEEDRFDRGPEWRMSKYADEENRHNMVRANGSPMDPSLHDGGLWTNIGTASEALRNRRKYSRMRKLNTQARYETKQDRSRAYAFGEIRRLTSALDLGRDVRDRACALFADAQERDLLQGRSLEAFASGAVYAACRERGLARVPEEIADVARCSQSDLKLGYGVINQRLGLEASPITPVEYVPRFASALDVDEAVRSTAHEYARQARDQNVVNGQQPSAFAGACLYYAAREHGDKLTQGDVASVAGCSTHTLRTHRDELKTAFDE